jgi:DNA polymerase-4
MDAFFASVEVLDNPALRGKPVIVGGDMKRGVVSAASYEARAFGVHSAMPLFQARRLCPNGIFLRGRMDRYIGVSHTVMRCLEAFSPLVEQVSVDEAFVDLTGTEHLFGPPRKRRSR